MSELDIQVVDGPLSFRQWVQTQSQAARALVAAHQAAEFEFMLCYSACAMDHPTADRVALLEYARHYEQMERALYPLRRAYMRYHQYYPIVVRVADGTMWHYRPLLRPM